MANANKPFGLRWVGSLGDASASGNVQKFYTEGATAFFVGDTVITDGTIGRVNADDAYRPGVTIGSDTAVVLGVVTGFEPLPSSPTLRYHTASTPQYVYVNVDPMAIYEIQGDGDTWTADAIGSNGTLTCTTGNTTTGISNWVMHAASQSAAASLLILNMSPTPDNEMGVYTRFLVKMNLNQYANVALGIA
jgi:hypothetical protein